MKMINDKHANSKIKVGSDICDVNARGVISLSHLSGDKLEDAVKRMKFSGFVEITDVEAKAIQKTLKIAEEKAVVETVSETETGIAPETVTEVPEEEKPRFLRRKK